MTTHYDMYAPRYVSDEQLPRAMYSEVLPGLFQGGTADHAWVNSPAPLEHGDDRTGFDAVLTLFAWAQPFGWGVEELRYGFMDAHPRHADMSRVVEAARWAHQRWVSGQQVLIRCQAGLNRSGLLTALVLMLAGMDAAEAIRLIRSRRSEVALFNDDFVDWLLTDAADALGLQPSDSTPQAA
jgi:hypothetical protein